jgi:peptidyl-prolyl cis-trans isomerase SurA
MTSFNKFSALTACTILTLVLLCASASAETIDRIVANVNGEIILYSDLQRQIKAVEKTMPTLDVSDPAKKSQIEREVLTQMIQQRLADKEAERLKITVPSSEVELRIRQIAEHNHISVEQMEAELKAQGQSLEKFREEVKKEIGRQRLMEWFLKPKVLITDQQVDAYLRSEKGESASASQKVHLGSIVLPVGDKYGKQEEVEKTGREILDKLKAGADFKTLAKQYSKGPAAQEGGDLGYIAPEDVAPFIAQGLRNLKTGDVSGLVKGPSGYYILKIFDIDTEKVEKSNPALREKIRQTLYQQEMNRRFEEWVHDLESKAFIQISL